MPTFNVQCPTLWRLRREDCDMGHMAENQTGEGELDNLVLKKNLFRAFYFQMIDIVKTIYLIPKILPFCLLSTSTAEMPYIAYTF